MLTLPPALDAYRVEFERLSAEADALTSDLDDARFNWHPESGGWSLSQCIEHLNATARVYLPMLDEGIAEGSRLGLYGDGPFHYNWLGRAFVWLLEPPVRVRVSAPKAFLPAPERSLRDTMAAFRAYQVQYVDRLRQANGLDLARAHVRSPALRWLYLPLGSGFEAMCAHERRHLWQARRLLSRVEFPR